LYPLLLQLALILVNAVFACAEIALLSVSDAKLEKLRAQGNKKAKRLLDLTRQPAKFLATIQVGITLAGFLGSAFAAENFADRLLGVFSAWQLPIQAATLRSVSVVLITCILSLFTLILGELVPKRIAMKKAESLAFALAGLIWFISKLFAPVVLLLTSSTNALLRLLRLDPEAEDQAVTEEEIRLMVDSGSERGAIEQAEKEIIHNVFEFDDRSAAEVMTHRLDAELLRLKDDDAAWERVIVGGRHSRYPIRGETDDDIAGVLQTGDYLRLADRRREVVMAQAVRPAWFIPETIKTDVLFRRMQRNREHFAVVLDEYGGMAGVITMNDLLEQLVGDIDEDAVLEQPLIEKVDGESWSIAGAAQLDRVATALGVELPVDEYDTFAGYVFGLLGAVPEDGERPVVEDASVGMVIGVLEIKERRLERALVRRR
jgi:putative hemolysin